MKNPFKVGDLVKLRPDVLGRHSRSIPAHAGFTTMEFQWRDTLKNLVGKMGKVTRVSPDSKQVTVEFEEPWESKDEYGRLYIVNSIGIDYINLVPYGQDPDIKKEGFGYVLAKDTKNDPKHIPGEHWRIKFQSTLDLKKHGNTEKSPVSKKAEAVNETEIREIIQELLADIKKKVTETRETPDKNYIISGKSGPVTSYYCNSPSQGERMLQFGYSQAHRFQTLEQVRNKILQLMQKYKGITNWEYEVVQNPYTPLGYRMDIPISSNKKGHAVYKPVKKGDEWIVRYAIDGKTDQSKTYYTDDKQDALDTYAHILKTAEAENKKLS